MSQKKHLDLLCFVFFKGKGCSVHLFLNKKFLIYLIKSKSFLMPIVAYTSFTGWLRPCWRSVLFIILSKNT